MSPRTPILDQVKYPRDLRNFSTVQLVRLAHELRSELIEVVSKTGGHLGANLGTVELTVAIHSVFSAPKDKIIWDVGHQVYAHKILTGRRERMLTLRQGNGLSGFTKRSESEYDPFGAAHASTSISAALGYAVSRDLKGENNNIVAVIGDGAMTGGMAYEGMNNAGSLPNNLIVILNDNEMSIAPPVGALSRYLSRMITSKPLSSFRDLKKSVTNRFPNPVKLAADSADEFARKVLSGGNIFEELGFFYVGPIDGHDLQALIPVLRNLRDENIKGPILVHAITEKGKGYKPAEASSDKYHGVGKFDPSTGSLAKGSASAPSYTRVFAGSLIREAEKDDRIVAITAAMPSGTGLDLFATCYPERYFDVGLSEQHAITFAAGLAADGMRPFAAIYSTFLQRAFDQIVHDVAIQDLPVRFAIDRAGYVGADGQTHCGAFDTTYLGCLPNFILMAASDEAELVHMVATAANMDDHPIAFRYPRGAGVGIDMPNKGKILPIGIGRIIEEGTQLAILSYGSRLHDCLEARKHLEEHGVSTTIADARFAKPLDCKLINSLASDHEALITIEESSIGGFSAQVFQYLAEQGHLDGKLRYRAMFMPDVFLDHDTPKNQIEAAGLSATDIVKTALNLLGISGSDKIVSISS